MKTHLLACGGHFWCSGGHANWWVVPLTLATFAGIVLVLVVIAVIAGQGRRR